MVVQDNSAYHEGAVDAFKQDAADLISRANTVEARFEQYKQLLGEYKAALTALREQREKYQELMASVEGVLSFVRAKYGIDGDNFECPRFRRMASALRAILAYGQGKEE